MTDTKAIPIVKMDENAGEASIVSYNVPEPTSYSGNKYFEIDLEDLVQKNEQIVDGVGWHNLFRDFQGLSFTGRETAVNFLNGLATAGTLQGLIEQILNHGYNQQKKAGNNLTDLDKISKFFYLPSNFEGIQKIKRNIENEFFGCPKLAQQLAQFPVKPSATSRVIRAELETTSPTSINRLINIQDSLILNRFQKLTCIDDFTFVSQKLLEGNFIAIYKNLSGQYDYKFIPIPEEITPKLFIIEKYKLSSFLGNYGAGRTIKTFSLLPGEKTKITVETFKKTVIDSKQSSSILDSYTQESADEFEDTLSKEQSNKQSQQDKLSWHVEAEADANWGWGKAKVSGGASGENASQREDMSKSVANSVEKHAQKASAKRDVHIDTSYERKEETGEKTSIEREIENINVSRTLNFVFRQMNQQFLTLLHLVDAKIGYTSGLPGSYSESSISQLDSFLKSIISNQAVNNLIKEGIVDHLCFVIDHEGNPQSFLESKEFSIPNPIAPERPLKASYIRTKSNMISEYRNEESNLHKKVDGIIVSAQLNVMRTEGVFVEALLGKGDALDAYSHGLQDESVKAKILSNALMESEAKKNELGMKIVNDKNFDAAKIFEQVFPLSKLKKKTDDVA